jgi:hypothetical protein
MNIVPSTPPHLTCALIAAVAALLLSTASMLAISLLTGLPSASTPASPSPSAAAAAESLLMPLAACGADASSASFWAANCENDHWGRGGVGGRGQKGVVSEGRMTSKQR